MPNRNYEKGRRAEYKTVKVLEEAGYECTRTPGSKGRFDVIAWDDYSVIFIQVKIDCLPSSKEIKKLKLPPFPKMRNCTREVWIWETGNPEPEVSVIF